MEDKFKRLLSGPVREDLTETLTDDGHEVANIAQSTHERINHTLPLILPRIFEHVEDVGKVGEGISDFFRPRGPVKGHLLEHTGIIRNLFRRTGTLIRIIKTVDFVKTEKGLSQLVRFLCRVTRSFRIFLLLFDSFRPRARPGQNREETVDFVD